jgi:RHS repeat-associated protein
MSGDLLEASAFYPNGAREHWLDSASAGATSVPLEPAGFTGKEGANEVGLTYFGERYLLQHLGRWATPDPLAIHQAQGGEVLNAYHYVSGNLLQARDPLGLAPFVVPETPDYRMASGQLEGPIQGTGLPDVSAFRSNAHQVVGWNQGPVVMNRARHESRIARERTWAGIGAYTAVAGTLVAAAVLLPGSAGVAAREFLSKHGADIVKDAVWAGTVRSIIQQGEKSGTVDVQKTTMDTLMRPITRITDLMLVRGFQERSPLVAQGLQFAIAEGLDYLKETIMGNEAQHLTHVGRAGIAKLCSDSVGTFLDEAMIARMGKDEFEKKFKESAPYQSLRQALQGTIKNLAEFTYDQVTGEAKQPEETQRSAAVGATR